MDRSNIMRNKEAYFEPEQVQTILNYCYDNKDFRSFMLFFILYRTGRRITELLGKPPYSGDGLRSMSNYRGLRPSDIVEKTKSIQWDILKKNPVKKKFKNGKDKPQDKLLRQLNDKEPKRVIIAMDSELYSYLVWYIDYAGISKYDRVFPISRRRADQLLKRVIGKIGLKMNLGRRKIKNRGVIYQVDCRPHLHMFRHSFAINVLSQNQKNPLALPKLTDLLQHSDMNMTKRYLQFTDKSTGEFLDKTFGVDEE